MTRSPHPRVSKLQLESGRMILDCLSHVVTKFSTFTRAGAFCIATKPVGARWQVLNSIAHREHAGPIVVLLHARTYRKSFFLFAFSGCYKIGLSDTRIRCERCVLRNGLSPGLFALRALIVPSPLIPPLPPPRFIRLKIAKGFSLKRESPRRNRSSPPGVK